MNERHHRLPQLASYGGGALALVASDEFFGPKERLVFDAPPAPPGQEYTERGKRVDGWETRRTRGPMTPDWCVLRLATPAILEQVHLDTRGFHSNAPATWWLEGCDADEGRVLAHPESLTWETLLGEQPVTPDGVDERALASAHRVSHVRLWIAPDGGVARLRLFGRPLVDATCVADHAGRAELASASVGGRVVACSDEAFAEADALCWLTGPATPAEGWETRRRRRPGVEWVVLRLAAEAEIERIDLDTTHFIGNAPERMVVDVATAEEGADPGDRCWSENAATVSPRPHRRNHVGLQPPAIGTHVRLRLDPDGGLARVAVHGRITQPGWERQQLAVLNHAGTEHALDVLFDLCPSVTVGASILSKRPHRDVGAVQAAAEAALAALSQEQLRQAADAHPRIGASALSGRSREEQRALRSGDDARARLAETAEEYERLFGFRFLVDAPGRAPDDLLDEMGRRMGHTQSEELARARQELTSITRRRIAEWARRPEGDSARRPESDPA